MSAGVDRRALDATEKRFGPTCGVRRPEREHRNILRAGFREAYVRPNWVVHSAAG